MRANDSRLAQAKFDPTAHATKKKEAMERAARLREQRQAAAGARMRSEGGVRPAAGAPAAAEGWEGGLDSVFTPQKAKKVHTFAAPDEESNDRQPRRAAIASPRHQQEMASSWGSLDDVFAKKMGKVPSPPPKQGLTLTLKSSSSASSVLPCCPTVRSLVGLPLRSASLRSTDLRAC